MPKRDDSLVVFMVKKAGMRRALKAAGYIAAWGILARELGRDPTWAEYESYWKCSQSTHARESKAFRACFGDVTMPEVWAHISRGVQADDLEEATSLVMSARWAS